MNSVTYLSTDGMTPAAPLVGAVTTRPPEALTSFTVDWIRSASGQEHL